ncbi:uncharacterized protein LOC110694316 isoform X2 [Chenopodium quinoa]|uniref:uncharacterized protein LOC110694316 isoform X2 n=1 Tax=Chenopodium quinoa TaxID=63459 RepID=UPI000B771D90|nr:uncharacterized protein LOC110694316 isoform X2 [Chenopodium quinoa]
MTTISKRKRSSIGGATASEDQPPKIEKPMFLDNGQKVIQLHAGLFKENSISVGGLVKERSAVLMEHSASSCRIYYLDRLNRDLIQWGVYPRIKVWNMKQIWKAGKCDRLRTGDYGCLGVLDVAYGEYHPREARDTEGPMTKTEYPDMSKMEGCKDRRRRAPIQAT